ncbi:MAG: leucine-rich repeat protein [Oscillospiraceae bacterium]|nr:leucine-rich repeat protein [Oscillospiraceae bacterium]
MKKLLSVLLVICMLTALVVPAAAAEVASGDCGVTDATVKWSYDDVTKTLTLSGAGAMEDYTLNSVPWSEYRGEVEKIVIGDEITAIGAYAFARMTNLQHADIPASVTSVGTQAFAGDTSLLTVIMGNGVQTIKAQAFKDCTKLLGISLGSGLLTIGDKAFSGCSSLKKAFYIGTSSDWNNVDVGSDNSALTSVLEKLTGNVSGEVGEDNTWTMDPATLTLTISGTGSIPALTAQDPYGWSEYSNVIRELVIEDGVTGIGARAFKSCVNLTTARIGKDVATIGENAFQNCTCLETVYYGGSIDQWVALTENADTTLTSADIEPAEPCGHTLTKTTYNKKDDETHNVIVNCKTCNKQISDTLSDCVDSDKDLVCDNCGDAVACKHDGEENFAYVQVEGEEKHTVTVTCKICGEQKGNVSTANCVDANADLVCDKCEGAVSENLGSGEGSGEGDGEGSGEGEGSGDVTTCQHSETETVYVEVDGTNHTVKTVCKACEQTVGTETTEACVDSDKDFACDKCEAAMTYVAYRIDEATGTLYIWGNTEMDDYSTAPWYNQRAKITKAVIEYGVTYIGKRAFYNCTNLTEVTIPVSVKTVAAYAFYRCNILASVKYGGTEAQWDEISIQSYNEPLLKAVMTGACGHAQTTTTKTPNANGTHNITVTCDACGEVISSVKNQACDVKTTYEPGSNDTHTVVTKCTICGEVTTSKTENCTLTTTNVPNGDRTHTTTKTCSVCNATSTVKNPCVDENDNDLCDKCNADLACAHNGYLYQGYVSKYDEAADRYTHQSAHLCVICGESVLTTGNVITCVDADSNSVCDVCGQAIPCRHVGKYTQTEYFSNGFGTRTHQEADVTYCPKDDCDVADEKGILNTEIRKTAVDCVDVKGAFDDQLNPISDDVCDLCGQDLECSHAGTTEIKYEIVKTEDGKCIYEHVLIVYCTHCKKNVTEDQMDCKDKNSDGKCDACGAACDHNYEYTYEIVENAETHKATWVCAWCKDQGINTEEACVDTTAHDGVCDKCGDAVVCKHKDAEVKYEKMDGEVHKEIFSCDTCANAEAAAGCEKCASAFTEVEVECIDEDHDQKCDDCGDTVACMHDGEDDYTETNNNGTHKVKCDYCDEVKEEATACEYENFICKECGYNSAIATTGENKFYGSVKDAVAAVDAEGTVTLLKNTEITEAITADKAFTLDLGGKELTINVEGSGGAVNVAAALTVKNGKITSVNNIFRMTEGELVLADDLTAASQNGYVVFIRGGKLKTAAKLTASGGFATITGNGLYQGDAEITGGSVTHTSDIAISWPQDGKLVVSGGTITGTTALYVKGGEVEISGGKLEATGEMADFVHGDNGATATGDALVVENSDYPAAPPVVNISGGTFTSKNALPVVKYSVEGAEGEATLSITGGTYDYDVTEYVAEGYECVEANVDLMYTVQKKAVIKTTVAGSNMNLGNELQVNFIVNNPVEGDYVAYVHQETKAEGGVTYTIADEAWEAFGTTRQRITVRVRAMEMTDKLTLTIKNADGEDIIDPYITSVREYGAKALVAATSSAAMKTVVVDMLNYGAAAQTNFNYKADDLANNQLTDAQKALATGAVTCENKQVKDANTIGSNLALDDCILLNVFFKGFTGKDVAKTYAKVTFTNWKNEAKEVIIPGTEFELYKTADQYKVTVDDIVLADASCLVTVEVYEEGAETPFASCTDSVESYANRGAATASAPLYEAIMKFATSAKAYLLTRQ